jgi:hypothetical protein
MMAATRSYAGQDPAKSAWMLVDGGVNIAGKGSINKRLAWQI